MSRGRRIALVVVGLLAVVVGTPIAVLVGTFAPLAPLVDGAELPGGAVTVVDGNVATFLIPLGDDTYALVDAGNDPTGAPIDLALAARGATRTDVVAILLTHGHPDHVASCAGFPSATVYAGRPELPLLKGEVGAKGPFPRLFGKFPSPCGAVTPVDDGAVIPIGPKTAVAFAIPGHTAGSVVWAVDGVLYFGDAASSGRNGKVSGAMWIFSDDQPKANLSLADLAPRLVGKVEPVALAFAHSGPLSGVDPLVAYTRDND